MYFLFTTQLTISGLLQRYGFVLSQPAHLIDAARGAPLSHDFSCQPLRQDREGIDKKNPLRFERRKNILSGWMTILNKHECPPVFRLAVSVL